MSTRRSARLATWPRAAAVVMLALCVGVAAQTPATQSTTQSASLSRPTAPVGPGLGRPATPAEIAAVDISVGPDGDGLPPGSGTPKQGADVYVAKCVACHGPEGANGINDRLVGGRGTLTSPSPVKTVGSYWPHATTIFDYVRRAMPYPAPHSLTDNDAYAVTAYLLHLNGIIGPDDVMDATSLPKVRMPNRDGFVNRTGRVR